MANKQVLHKRSSVPDKTPTAEQLDYGELAINFVKDNEKIFIKNSENGIATFVTEATIDAKIETLTGGGITDVKVQGTSPLTLSSEKSGTEVTINGSVDLSGYATSSDLSNLKTELEGEITTAAGGGITVVNASGTDPLTLEASVDDGVATIKGSVDLSNYATTSSLDGYLDKTAAANTYQEKLTAGTNISISNNTISATDTTYSAGDNISIDSDNKISADLSDYAKTSDLEEYVTEGQLKDDLTDYVTTEELNKAIEGITPEEGGTVSKVVAENADTTGILQFSGTPQIGDVTITAAIKEEGLKTYIGGFGYVTDDALSNYLLTSTAANTYQAKLTAGDNISISNNTISATDTTYTAGTNVSISDSNVISATDTTYTAGTNISISDSNVISATDTTYTAGENVKIDESNVISVPDATSDMAGVVKPYSVLETKPSVNGATSEDGRYYQVQTDSENKLVVNVPWVKGESGQSGIDEVTASGTAPLTLTATQTDSRVNISGSVDLSGYTKTSDLESKQDKLLFYTEVYDGSASHSGNGAFITLTSAEVFNVSNNNRTFGVTGTSVALSDSYSSISVQNDIKLNTSDDHKAYYNDSEIATVTDIEGYATKDDLSSYVSETTLSEKLNDYVTKSVASATYQNKLQYYREETLSSQSCATIDASRLFLGKQGDYRYFEGNNGIVTIVGGDSINMQTIGSQTVESFLDMDSYSINIYVTHGDEKTSDVSLKDEKVDISASIINLITTKEESNDNIATYNGSEIATVDDLKRYSFSSEANVGDVLFYDSVNNTKFTVPIDSVNTDDYPSTQYTPIGVVAIPSSHNVYGTKEAGIMSLAWMSRISPETGVSTNSTELYTHLYITPINLGEEYPKSGCASNGSYQYTGGTLYEDKVGSIITEIISEPKNPVYLPSEYHRLKSGVTSPTDSNSFYDGLGSNVYYAAISPYFSDGSKNNAYSQVFPASSKNNALSDFDGKNNTIQTLCNVSSTDWQSSETITISDAQSAFECCWRYHTVGTNPGDWYLPSLGEVGYVVVRYSTIHNSINILSELYGSTDIPIGFELGDVLWTSTMINNYAWAVDLTSDNTSVFGKVQLKETDTHTVRAFTRF